MPLIRRIPKRGFNNIFRKEYAIVNVGRLAELAGDSFDPAKLLELGVIHGVVEKSGAWYIYNGDRLGQGKDNSRDFLTENPAIAREIKAKIRAKAGLIALQPEAAEAGEAGAEPAEESNVIRAPTRRRSQNAA